MRRFSFCLNVTEGLTKWFSSNLLRGIFQNMMTLFLVYFYHWYEWKWWVWLMARLKGQDSLVLFGWQLVQWKYCDLIVSLKCMMDAHTMRLARWNSEMKSFLQFEVNEGYNSTVHFQHQYNCLICQKVTYMGFKVCDNRITYILAKYSLQ